MSASTNNWGAKGGELMRLIHTCVQVDEAVNVDNVEFKYECAYVRIFMTGTYLCMHVCMYIIC